MNKRTTSIYLLGFITASALWGCSQGAVEKPPGVTLPQETDQQGSGARKITQAQATCSRSENCNESTGMLLSADNVGVHVCTASLVAPDILMTNGQCIYPTTLRSAHADCSGIWVKFPEMGGLAAESEECGTVLESVSSVASGNQVDYAFLKLKSAAHRLPLSLNFDGFNDQQSFTFFKFDVSTNGDQITGVMGRQTCQSFQNSLLFPAFNRAEAPLVGLVGCEVAAENAGAPLLDDRGRVHGVIQIENVSAVESQDDLQKYSLDGQYEPMHLASNLACMISPEALPGHASDPACVDANAAQDGVVSLSSLVTKLKPELDNERASFSSQFAAAKLSPHVRWGVGDLPMISSLLTADETTWGNYGALGLSAKPTCIANMESWIQQYSGGILGMKRSADEVLNLPVETLRLGIDQNQTPGYRPGDFSSVPATLHFDPQEVFHNGSGTFEVHIKRQSAPRAGDDEILFSVILTNCPL